MSDWFRILRKNKIPRKYLFLQSHEWMTYNSSNIQWTGKRNFHAKLIFSHEIRHDNAILRKKKVLKPTISYPNIIFFLLLIARYILVQISMILIKTK